MVRTLLAAAALTGLLAAPASASVGRPGDPTTGTNAVQTKQSAAQAQAEKPKRFVHCPICNAWYTPPLAIAPDGGFFTLWIERGVGANDETLYLRRMKPDGTDAWTKFLPVFNARRKDSTAFAIRDPDIVPDGFGGVIVAWSSTDENGYNVYAQRIEDNGAFYWDKPARMVCGAPGDQVHAKLMVDKIGGAFLGWQDQRSGNWDVYVQHVMPSGKLSWNETGLQITNQSRNEYLTTLGADGLGGIWITWWDERTGKSDLLSMHVDALGKLTTPKPYVWRQYE